MGAGGVMPPPRAYWREDPGGVPAPRRARRRRRGHHRLRAHRAACSAARPMALEPDVLIVSKALTSSYFPLSALLFTDAIYQAARRQFQQDRRVRARLHRQRPSRAGPRSRWKISTSSKSAISSAMRRASRRISRRACRASPSIRWSAKRAASASSARWNSSPTRATKAPFAPPGCVRRAPRRTLP